MPRDRVTTNAGNTYTRETTLTDDGDISVTYRGPNGQFVSKQTWAAAQSHTPMSEIKRGNVDPADVDPADLNAPFDADFYEPLGERSGEVRERRAEKNRFYGFLAADNTPDDRVAAAVEYERMKRRLERTDDPEQERKIKAAYGIGGS